MLVHYWSATNIDFNFCCPLTLTLIWACIASRTQYRCIDRGDNDFSSVQSNWNWADFFQHTALKLKPEQQHPAQRLNRFVLLVFIYNESKVQSSHVICPTEHANYEICPMQVNAIFPPTTICVNVHRCYLNSMKGLSSLHNFCAFSSLLLFD